MTYGRGFGFRGASPDWPYAGRGRGGLPRCCAPGISPAAFTGYAGRGRGRGYNPPTQSNEQELDLLRAESSELKRRLEEIESRINKIESR